MLVTDVLKEREVWALMREEFPGIDEEVGAVGGAGLLHLEFAALRRRLELAIEAGDNDAALRILGFVEGLLARAIHLDVENAIDVSFVEDLYLGEESWRGFVTPLLPSKIRAKWNETVAAYATARSG
jgi:hypothetical protein